MQAEYPLWGEACWNEFGILYYFSGFVGYLLLGLYVRKFSSEINRGRALAMALPCFMVGFAVCAIGFVKRVLEYSDGVFPQGANVRSVPCGKHRYSTTLSA